VALERGRKFSRTRFASKLERIMLKRWGCQTDKQPVYEAREDGGFRKGSYTNESEDGHTEKGKIQTREGEQREGTRRDFPED